jgi:hypothetical protein
METYKVTLFNPSGNPEEIETEYVSAESQKDAELDAIGIVARHPFDDIEIISVELVSPRELYHEEISHPL